MRIFGLIIEREKGRVVGSLEPAIIDLQQRVAVLEHNHRVVVKEAQQEQAHQSEIDKILSGGTTRESIGGLWEGL